MRKAESTMESSNADLMAADTSGELSDAEIFISFTKEHHRTGKPV